MRKNIDEILDGLSWTVLGVHEMGKVDGGTEKVDGRNGRKGWRRTGGEEGKGKQNEEKTLIYPSGVDLPVMGKERPLDAEMKYDDTFQQRSQENAKTL